MPTSYSQAMKISRRRWPCWSDHWGGPADRWERALRRAEAGEYRFSPVTGVRNREGEVHYVWNAEDAVVLKWLCQRLKALLPSSPHCTHLEGNGGVYGARSRASEAIKAGASFHCRTDVKGYYASIDHFRMMDMVARYVSDPGLLRLVWGVLRRVQDMDGVLRRPQSGLPRSCSLSPLLGGLYLHDVDEKISALPGVTYIRYMDDILILSDRRCFFRRAVKTLNQEFAALDLEKHPDKTSMGRLCRRKFSFLQRRFGEVGMEEPQFKDVRGRTFAIDWNSYDPVLPFEYIKRHRYYLLDDEIRVRRQVFWGHAGIPMVQYSATPSGHRALATAKPRKVVKTVRAVKSWDETEGEWVSLTKAPRNTDDPPGNGQELNSCRILEWRFPLVRHVKCKLYGLSGTVCEPPLAAVRAVVTQKNLMGRTVNALSPPPMCQGSLWWSWKVPVD